ncbi:right-handed parallel beta-helix repeat-containing protein [Blastococcus sp. SYSU DS0973]
MERGAVGNGRADDTRALQRALDELAPGGTLLLPSGYTFAHDDVLKVRTPGVTLTGGGSLLATDEERSAVRVLADDVTVRDVEVGIERTTRRWSAPQQTGLWLDGHRGTVVEDVTVRDSASAGVFVQGAEDFRLIRVTVRGSRADGVHMTAGARGGLVEDVATEDTGDDGVAVVSYLDDHVQAHDIRIASPRVDGTTWGRGISVVGGRDVTLTDVDVRDTAAAGIYIACERGEFRTRVPSGVRVSGGRVSGANQVESVDHGAVLLYNGQGEESLRNVTIDDLRLHDSRDSASRQVGLIADADGPLLGITLTGIAVTGKGPAILLASNTERLRVHASGWSVDGDPVPDREIQAATLR